METIGREPARSWCVDRGTPPRYGFNTLVPEDERDRRTHERFSTRIAVDCASGETFLFSYIENISLMGIFIRSDYPLGVGTELELRLGAPPEPLDLRGEVVWINPLRPDGDNINAGMGVRFTELTPPLRARLVDLVRRVAYLSDDDEDAN